MLRNYPQNILDLFSEALQGDEKAFKALMTTEKCPELAAFSSAINGDEKAEIFLRARVGVDWWLMCKAIENNENAMKQFQQRNDKFYVSFALACQDRIEGIHWLEVNNYANFLPICQCIVNAIKRKNSDLSWLYKAHH